MGGVDHYPHANAGFACDGTGFVYGAIGRQMAKPVISIDEYGGAARMRDGYVRLRLADAATQAIGIEGQEPYSMTVNAKERSMQHRPGCRLCLLLIAAGRSKHRQ